MDTLIEARSFPHTSSRVLYAFWAPTTCPTLKLKRMAGRRGNSLTIGKTSKYIKSGATSFLRYQSMAHCQLFSCTSKSMPRTNHPQPQKCTTRFQSLILVVYTRRRASSRISSISLRMHQNIRHHSHPPVMSVNQAERRKIRSKTSSNHQLIAFSTRATRSSAS